jgi:glucose-6-phosphate dehydrogenase assembly protein OpcA
LASAFDDNEARATSAQVSAEAGSASASLVAGWLTARLGVRSRVVTSDGPGITAVDVRFDDSSRIRIDRPDGHTATLSRTGRPDRPLPLKRRDLGDLIAEELRRLDADQPYAEALAAVTGGKNLNERSAKRTHIWREPPGTEAGSTKTATGAAKTTRATTKKATKKPAKKAASAKASR